EGGAGDRVLPDEGHQPRRSRRVRAAQDAALLLLAVRRRRWLPGPVPETLARVPTSDQYPLVDPYELVLLDCFGLMLVISGANYSLPNIHVWDENEMNAPSAVLTRLVVNLVMR
uniref:Uncharacterized protein n=1 Tax=Aegilops tauschii subsp. strangulata TaxID=200361 RepID=A0A452ZGP1_AEGTS